MMRRLAVLACLVAYCAAIYTRPINDDCLANVDSSSTDTSLFPSQYQITGSGVISGDGFTQVESSTGFTVTYYDTYKVVNNTLTGDVYTLLQCGYPTPNDLPEHRTFSIPITSLSIPETVPYAYLQLLGITDRVFDVSEYVVAPCGQRLVQECNRASPDAMQLDNSTLLMNSIAGYTDGLVYSNAIDWPTQFTFSGASAPGLLERAEWIKFLGVFFNLDGYASHVYTAIKNNYDSTAARAAKEPSRPTVAWISHYVYLDEENYQVSFAPYKVELIEAAGAVPLNQTDLLDIEGVQNSEFSPYQIEFGWQTNGSFASKEEALEALLGVLADVDIIVDETFVADPTTYNMTSFLEEFSAGGIAPSSTDPWVQNSAVHRPDGLLSASMGWDWYEGAIPRADRVLMDMVSITHPSALEDASYTPTWLRWINSEPVVVTAADCQLPDSCNGVPATICPYISFCGDGTPVLLKTDMTTGTAIGNKCQYETCPTNVGGNA